MNTATSLSCMGRAFPWAFLVFSWIV